MKEVNYDSLLTPIFLMYLYFRFKLGFYDNCSKYKTLLPRITELAI